MIAIPLPITPLANVLSFTSLNSIIVPLAGAQISAGDASTLITSFFSAASAFSLLAAVSSIGRIYVNTKAMTNATA